MLPILLRDVHAPQGFWSVASLSQRVDGLRLLRWSVPGNPVHSSGSFALIFRHSSHGKDFATERAGQETLEGLHLPPSPGLYCLHDTRLEPTHVLLAACQSIWCQSNGWWEDAPAGAAVICFSSCVSSPASLVMSDPAEVCPLSRGVMLGESPQPLSELLPLSLRLLRHPVPAAPLARLTTAYPEGSTTGLPCSALRTRMG